ncbi:hypothetical protein L6452_13477 [Arctium lappa]|uniref:Uncharacterized protein n=1 Tax=Arctium lappa TaxID=4217 RepID=A0ACB9CIB0_ARCLA|nr:hypothetical protein L6452_13477 [Arctium lappa]
MLSSCKSKLSIFHFTLFWQKGSGPFPALFLQADLKLSKGFKILEKIVNSESTGCFQSIVDNCSFGINVHPVDARREFVVAVLSMSLVITHPHMMDKSPKECKNKTRPTHFKEWQSYGNRTCPLDICGWCSS